jgi:hypothetical protein
MSEPTPSQGDSLFGTTPPGRLRETFTVQVEGAGGFDLVAGALGRRLDLLSSVPGQHNVVLELRRPGNHFVQAIVDATDGAWIEAVSNEFIRDQRHRLDDAQELTLVELGFSPPNESPNFFRHEPQPVDWFAVAALMVGALRLVYGATDTDELVLSIYPHHRSD